MRNHNYRLFRIYGYPVFGVLLYLFFQLINPVENWLRDFMSMSIGEFFLQILFCVGYASILFELGIQLTHLLNKWYPWERGIGKRIAIQLGTHSIITLLLIQFFFEIYLRSYFQDETLYRQVMIIGIILCLLNNAVFTAEYFFHKWNDASVKGLELERLSNQAQLDVLKLQLDPHFLFNNLSAAISLVEDEPKVAISFITKLVSIYRYMLSNKSQHIISLQEELDFIRGYLYLYQTRYGESIQVEIADFSQAHKYGVPPLTLQLLIENAIKHNMFSLDEPLTIQILITDKELIAVKNNKSPRLHKEVGLQMGLKNIEQRYVLMNKVSPVIIDKEDSFTVEIPLIKLSDQE